jgi:cytochrome c1
VVQLLASTGGPSAHNNATLRIVIIVFIVIMVAVAVWKTWFRKQ